MGPVHTESPEIQTGCVNGFSGLWSQPAVVHTEHAVRPRSPGVGPDVLLLTNPGPVADGMTDQGNRLSYILINPSPDARLELHDVV